MSDSLRASASPIADGGPAFPSPELPYWNWPGSIGLSLRDYIAIKAMVADRINLGAHYHADESECDDCRAATAKRAYRMADAMLAEREGRS